MSTGGDKKILSQNKFATKQEEGQKNHIKRQPQRLLNGSQIHGQSTNRAQTFIIIQDRS